MSKHKNSNDALGNYGIYEIVVNDHLYKIGKADLDRITLSSGDPTRLHQQIVKLYQKYGKQSVLYSVVQKLFGVTTQQAKDFERIILETIYEQTKVIPQGNQKSFKP